MATSSPASAAAAAGGSVTTVVTETLAGTRVLMTVDGYSEIKEALVDAGSRSVKSERFRAGGHSWYIAYRPFVLDEDGEEDGDFVGTYPCLDRHPAGQGDDGAVKVRYELSLLNRDGRETISSTRSFYTFSIGSNSIGLEEKEPDTTPLLEDSFQVRCDLTVVDKIATVRPPDLHRHFGSLLESQVGVDVTFYVGGETFTAHRCVLAARSPVFMAELFGPWKENAAAATPIPIDGMEPAVFRALLHFIYTDTLPEVKEGDDGDKVAMAQGLLVAVDRYGVERLKLICGDMLCNHIDARTAMTLLQLADSDGCRRLKMACTVAITDMLATLASP